MKVLFRPLKESDHNFILSTWLKCEKSDGLDFKCQPRIFYRCHEEEIKRILETSGGFVACPDDDHGQILGYAVLSGNCLHFAYTKVLYRRHGIFKGLIAACGNPSEYSRAVRMCLLVKKYLGKYNPYRFWRDNGKEKDKTN